ncbi:MAG TPA: hypothetical protein VGQ43_09845 [Candidatus Udaeobacter sp.]|jgi:hypothetical protein|nr:hypothetical protein [Candidatus Udaeobacter sp.]
MVGLVAGGELSFLDEGRALYGSKQLEFGAIEGGLAQDPAT